MRIGTSVFSDFAVVNRMCGGFGPVHQSCYGLLGVHGLYITEP
jgi:hypothetical protein